MKDPKEKLNVVSLFSGAGFSDFGFIQARHPRFKFEMVQAYDYDAYACQTYAHNLNTPIEQVDLTEYDLTSIPHAPIMLLTPSCFGFSNNNRSGNTQRKQEQNDLTKRAVEAILANPNCQVFVIENAPQLLTHEKGAYLTYILETLSDFEISYGVLNAVDFGAPQHRKRAFLIGSKLGKIPLPQPTHTPSHYQTVGDALANLSPTLPNMQDITTSSPLVRERMSFIPPGGNIQSIPEAIRPNGKMSNAYRRLKADEPAISIVNYRKSMISPPTENRILSVREACRLMGVPDHYEILGTLSSKQQQTCNGVVPSIMTAIGELVFLAFEQTFDSQKSLALS